MPRANPHRFRLSLVNAAEDVPRVVRAYGRACDGEFALVLRPPEERGVLVLVKKEGAWAWKATSGHDHPGMPTLPVSAADAVALVKTEQRAVPRPGPITLRGQWSGWMHCEGVPRVELVRKLAAYGVLRVVSDPEGGWTWTVERTEKWFAEPGSDTGTAHTLVRAIEGGLARAMGLLGEACSVRDSRRRAALDTEYAEAHPVRPARETRNPTERLKEPKAAKPRASSPWRHFQGEGPEADPIDRVSRAVSARLRAGGLRHEPGAGSFLGRAVEAHEGFPVGALVFRGPGEDGGFYLSVPVEEPKRRARKPRAKVPAPSAAPVVEAGEVDAAKDKALLEAFSAAVAAAMAS